MNKKLIEPKSVTELYAYISTWASKLERKLNRLPEHSEEYKLANSNLRVLKTILTYINSLIRHQDRYKKFFLFRWAKG